MLFFMAELEEKILIAFEEKAMIWWWYIFFLFVNMEKILQKKFLNKLNSFYPTIKFTGKYAKERIIFQMQIQDQQGELMTDLFVKPRLPIHTSLQIQTPLIFIVARKNYQMVKLLKLNIIYCEKKSFDKRCNDLEKWLMEREYNG